MKQNFLEKLILFNSLMKFVSDYYFKDLEITSRSSVIRKVLYKVKLLYMTRGSLETAKYIKLCRLAVSKHLANEPIELPFGISLAKDNLPAILPRAIREKIKARNILVIS